MSHIEQEATIGLGEFTSHNIEEAFTFLIVFTHHAHKTYILI